MQATNLAIVLLAFAAAAASGPTGLPITFLAPGQVSADLAVDDATWLLVTFLPQGRGEWQLRFDAPTQLEEFPEVGTDVYQVSDGSHIYDYESLPPSTDTIGPTTIRAHQTSTGPSSIYLEADHISWHVVRAVAEIGATPGGNPLPALATGMETYERAARYEKFVPDASADVFARSGGQLDAFVTIKASGISLAEWHNVLVDCEPMDADQCPSGGERVERETNLGSYQIFQRQLAFERLTGAGGELELTGDASWILGGGPMISVEAIGQVRLPLAQGDAKCPECLMQDQQTLQLNGRTLLQDVRPGNAGRLATSVSGDFTSARLDETSIDPKLLTGTALAGGAATLGIIVALKYLLGALFTKLSKEKALQHPRRLVIYTYVKEHPGANFREILRATNIASGTARHHLTILKRSGHLVEHPHGATVRFFENHGKFDTGWSDVVLLREPSLKELYDWLVVHPNVPQKAILQGMATAGWSRSTTQHRLSRLVEGGVVTLRLQGRLKFYAPKTMPTTGIPAGGVNAAVPVVSV